MIGTWLMLLCVAAALVLGVQAWRAWAWHHRGRGERKARVEYLRMQCAGEDTAEARLSQTEFTRYYIASRPTAARYVITLLLGLPAACALLAGWPWN